MEQEKEIEEVTFICIGCPLGCQLSVKKKEDMVISVEGNHCKRGEIYAQKECVSPTRIVTTTVKVQDGEIPMLSVKTASDIPKSKIRECMDAVRNIVVIAPIEMGDVILHNVAETGVDIIATKKVGKRIQ